MDHFCRPSIHQILSVNLVWICRK
uniref:Uncharacterized protein n=1 Tax=Anguilla anguilla TaxID=7936 RepID=A0A0E9UGD8_ANGAN